MREPLAPGPVALRIRLGATLRRLRESRGITAQQAAAQIRGSDSKISRIELGRQPAREIDVADLLTLYGVTDSDEREALLELAGRALAPPWWRPYSDILPAWFQAYLGVEEAAESVRSYDTHFIPGLLQTREYAEGLLARADFGQHQTGRLLEARSKRIERFAAAGWRLAAVIDEAVLYRPVGGRREFAAQLEHLADAAGRPGMTVRIRPLTAGAPPSPAGFTILHFADGDIPDAVYSEQLTSASYVDRPADVARYSAAMDLLERESQPPDRTAVIVAAARDRLG